MSINSPAVTLIIVSKLLVVLIILGKTYYSSNFDLVSKLLILSIIFGRQLMNYYDVLQNEAKSTFFASPPPRDDDSKAGQPLFNKKAWKRENSVLRETLRSEASDPPGFEFYAQRLDAMGKPKTDKSGIQLIDCNRGTNDVENEHKQYVTTSFGTWYTGVETSCTLLAERQHQYNQRMTANYRVAFPKIGHYDTGKIDLLQLLVEKNHGKRLYP
jgi:hypothetical protein